MLQFQNIPSICVPEVSLISEQSSIVKHPLTHAKTPIPETFADWRNKHSFSPKKPSPESTRRKLQHKKSHSLPTLEAGKRSNSPQLKYVENAESPGRPVPRKSGHRQENFSYSPNDAYHRYDDLEQFNYRIPPNGPSHGRCNCKNDESETMKNMMILMNSQAEQIKCLQAHLDRLLKIHEDALKDRQKCCSCETNRGSKELVRSVENGPISRTNGESKNQQENFAGQKVSIGVMTSWELKVQNNENVEKRNVPEKEDSR